MRSTTTRIIGVILTLAAVGGCKGVPDGVLSERKLAEVMVDLQFAEAMVNEQLRISFADDSAKSLLLQSVLDRHGITQADYDSTLRWYGHNMVRYVDACELADSMIADSLRAIDRRIELARSRRGGGADTVDVWPHMPSHLFSSTLSSDYLAFSMERDTSWRKGDMFIWEMEPVNNRTSLQVKMMVDYADARSTTEILESAMTSSQDKLTMTFQLDSNKVARRVYGYIYLPAADGEFAYLNNISLKRTRLDSEDYYRSRRLMRPFFSARRYVGEPSSTL